MDSMPLLIYVSVDNDIKSKHILTIDNFSTCNAKNKNDGSSVMSSNSCLGHNLSVDVNTKQSPTSTLKTNILAIKPIVDELQNSSVYREQVYHNLNEIINKNKENSKAAANDFILFKAFTKDSYVIDYAWGWRLWRECHMGLQRECASAWLSTLGGAFSALGDNSTKCAEMALRISSQQIRLAKAGGDPTGVARGWLFLALATSQLGHGPLSRALLRAAMEQPSCDPRHRCMCLGVQAKLRYDSKLRRFQRRKLRGDAVPDEEPTEYIINAAELLQL